MKRFVLTLCALGLWAAGTVCAQDAIRVTIPFDFYVGESDLMPAGTYNVSPCAQDLLRVQHCDQGVAVMQVMHPTGEPNEGQGKLVFYKYGTEYFLREVRGLPVSHTISLPRTTHEKHAEEELASVTTFETVILPKPDQEEKQPERPQPQHPD